MGSKKKMSRSEAGKLGGQKASVTWENKKKDNIKKYEDNPRVCLGCDNPLSYDKRTNKFCSYSCRASYTNKIRKRKDARKQNKCLYCGNLTLNQKFCNNKCQGLHKIETQIDNFEKNGEIGAKSDAGIRCFLKKYLLRTIGHKCELCKRTKWMKKPIPLIIDHIDGNSSNNSRDNIRLVCGNCDMQLETFAGRNIGNGRKKRREFYKKHGYC